MTMKILDHVFRYIDEIGVLVEEGAETRRGNQLQRPAILKSQSLVHLHRRFSIVRYEDRD